MNLMESLIELGLREEYDEPQTLHSGGESRVFWNIQKLYRYSEWMRLEVLREWIWAIGLLDLDSAIGIRRGGLKLAEDVGKALDIMVFNEGGYVEAYRPTGKLIPDQKGILIDDVLTTGSTIKQTLGNPHLPQVTHIAVLVNRSGMAELEGIPIISGISTDEVTKQT